MLAPALLVWKSSLSSNEPMVKSTQMGRVGVGMVCYWEEDIIFTFLCVWEELARLVPAAATCARFVEWVGLGGGWSWVVGGIRQWVELGGGWGFEVSGVLR